MEFCLFTFCYIEERTPRSGQMLKEVIKKRAQSHDAFEAKVRNRLRQIPSSSALVSVDPKRITLAAGSFNHGRKVAVERSTPTK